MHNCQHHLYLNRTEVLCHLSLLLHLYFPAQYKKPAQLRCDNTVAIKHTDAVTQHRVLENYL